MLITNHCNLSSLLTLSPSIFLMVDSRVCSIDVTLAENERGCSDDTNGELRCPLATFWRLESLVPGRVPSATLPEKTASRLLDPTARLPDVLVFTREFDRCQDIPTNQYKECILQSRGSTLRTDIGCTWYKMCKNERKTWDTLCFDN